MQAESGFTEFTGFTGFAGFTVARAERRYTEAAGGTGTGGVLMRRHPGVVLAAVVALLAFQTIVPAQTPPAQTLRSGVDLVLVDTIVVDRADRPVHGLRPGG